MTNTNVTLDIEGVGPVRFEKSRRRSRNISIAIRPDKTVRVAFPSYVAFEQARKFFDSRLDWVRKHFSKMEQTEALNKSKLVDVSHLSVQMRCEILKRRTRELASLHGFKFNDLTVRNQRTLWGSCSRANNINLNIKLVQLPSKLMDYVILHELVHLNIKDHSRHFWAELDRLTGSAKALRREIRSYRMGLM